MKPLLSCCSLLLLILVTSLDVNADIARPKPSPKKEPKFVLHTDLQIVADPKANDAWLQIRESDLKEMIASANGIEGNTAFASAFTRGSGRTVVAGVLLFVSISFAGVWFARSRRAGATVGKGQKTLMVALIVAAVLGVGAIITRGNAGPPPSYRWAKLPDNLAKGDATNGPINIAIIPDDQMESNTGMKLVLPLKKKTNPGEE